MAAIAPAPWPAQIIASHHTLSGVAIRTPSRFALTDRLRAARAAGYDGVGLTFYDYREQLAQGQTPDELRAATERLGISIVEVEMLYGWNSRDATERALSRETEQTLFEMARLFGARQVNVTVAEPVGALAGDRSALARDFGALCERAAEVGLLVALEFQPWNAVADIGTAWEIVRRAGHPNGGILLDSWHFFRGGADVRSLHGIPGERIVAVQINDAAGEVEGSLFDDSTERRLLPGDGIFALVELLRALRDMGVECPLAVEIISKAHRNRRLDEAARRSYESTLAVLERAGLGPPAQRSG